MKIPGKLYRGDDDRYQVRDLKATLNHSQLQTNLLRGGKGHEIFDSPIIDLIARHVDPGWAKTHFLSFSEDEDTAKRFALHCELDQVSDLIDEYQEYYENEKDWNFAIIEIDPGKISWKETELGIYEGFHEPSLLKFKEFPGVCSLMLIDVVTTAGRYPHFSNHKQVMTNALRDKEWLLLPTSKVKLNAGLIENSGIFDGYIISNITKYKK